MRRPLPAHSLLFAVFPVVFVYARNVRGEVSPGDLVVPLLVAVAGTLLVGAAYWLGFRDLHQAGLATSLSVFLVFSFGHIQNVIDPLGSRRFEGILLIAWGLLLVGGVLALAEPRKSFPRATGSLNVVAVVLLTINVVPILRFELGASPRPARAAAAPIVLGTGSDLADRDIYYLVFDRYAADRTLRDLYGFDNGAFSGWLEDRGFYVAQDSLANYPKTAHSLASSLNMTYLDDLAEEVGRDSADWEPLYDAIDQHRVATSLQQVGYRYLHVGSWWSPTGVNSMADENFVFDSPVGFADVLLDSTIVPALGRLIGLGDRMSQGLREYRRVGFQFEVLERIARDPAPTFTFAHFTLPHPPYVFEADGRFLPPEEAVKRTRKDLYLAQLQFTNTKIRELVEDLLSGPAGEDPIIVIQSDEGPHPVRLLQDEDAFVWPEASDGELGEKLRILNAYYLPGLDDPGLYPSISPANTFRLILSEYFGADLPLLPDETFVFERNAHPYRFTDVTTRLRP